MGPVGNTLGSALGNMASRALAKKYLGNDYADQSAVIGGALGGLGGALLPFKTGGKIPAQKNKPKVILAHGGGWVIPVEVKPTKSQRNQIEKIKKNLLVKW
jgi:hypothetical protein